MVEVSIVCLIYKSKKLAKGVYDSLYKYTPMLLDGRAELLFIANDPTIEVVDFLKYSGYPNLINVNERLSEEEMFKLGFGKPEYIRRVYQGYNQGILHSKGQRVVLINSDNFFSVDWLENLMKYSDYKKIVTSTLVEPGQKKFGVFPGAIQKCFGKTMDGYDDEGFQIFAAKISRTGYSTGGAYMPCLLYRDVAIIAGLYPEGNIAGDTFDDIQQYGDESFYAELNKFGVEHITAKDSIVYHLKEGERSDDQNDTRITKGNKYKYSSLDKKFDVFPVDLTSYIQPISRHLEILKKLSNKYTAIIIHFKNTSELHLQIKTIRAQSCGNIEIIVFYDNYNRAAIAVKDKSIKYIFAPKKYIILSKMICNLFGEYLIIPNIGCEYDNAMLDNEYSKDRVSYIGGKEQFGNVMIDLTCNFIFPKKLLLDNPNKYLGLLVCEIDVEIRLDELSLMHAKMTKRPVAQERLTKISKLSIFLKHTMPYRVIRKVYRDGLSMAIKAAINMVRGKSL